MARRSNAAEEAEAAATAAEAEEAENGRSGRSKPLAIDSLPAGVRAVLKLKPWREAEEYSAYIYRVLADLQRPGREKRKFSKKIFNQEIDEAWLQLNYPLGGKFRVIYQVPQEKGDAQIYSDDFDIEPLDGTAAALVAPGSAASPAPAQAGAGASGGPYDRRAMLAELKEMVELVNLLRPREEAAAAMPAWYESMMKDKLMRIADYEAKLERKVIVTTSGSAPAPANNGNELAAWPEFIRPFVPAIKQWGFATMQDLAGKLLGRGLESMGLRALVLNNPMFRQIWADEDKRNAAATALITTLGEAGENLVKLFAQEMQMHQAPAPGAEGQP